jgi:DNA polymerase III gamma/tau subunit
MGLVSTIVGNRNNQQPVVDQNALTTQELEFLLDAMRQILIKGEQVESFYNMIIKLQNQYVISQQTEK